MGKEIQNRKSFQETKHFEEQIHLIYKEMYRFLYSILHNREMTEDALQNAVEKICRTYNMLKDSTKFKSWAFTIAKNEAITLLRKRKRDYSRDLSELAGLCVNDGTKPEDMAIREEMCQSILEIIEGLRPEYRELIMLRYYSELSLEEIARATGVVINTVKTRHMRVKAILLREIQRRGMLEMERAAYAVEGEMTNGS